MNDDTGSAALARQLARRTRDWQSMIRITHDFFHAWRRAVAAAHGERAAREAELDFWERIGAATGAAYLARAGNPDDPAQLARAMLRASEVMGETAHVERDGDSTLLVHTACPWLDSYRAHGLPGQCGAGCDRWFQTAVRTVSPRMRVVTESRLPDGDASCTRRFTLARPQGRPFGTPSNRCD